METVRTFLMIRLNTNPNAYFLVLTTEKLLYTLFLG